MTGRKKNPEDILTPGGKGGAEGTFPSREVVSALRAFILKGSEKK